MRCLLEANSPLDVILNIFKDKRKTKDSKDNKKEKDNKYLGGSVSEYTKNLVMTFPTLCDSSLRPETASMVSKANERNIVAMLQMLFASMQLKGTNGKEIIEKLHKNITTSMSMDDYIDALDTIASRTASGKVFGESAKDKVVLRDMIKLVNESMKRPQRSFPVNSFSEKSLMNYSVMKDYRGRSIIKEIQYNPLKPEDVNDGTYSLIPKDQNAIAKGEFKRGVDVDSQIAIAKYNQETRKNRAQLIKTDQDLRYAKNKEDREAQKAIYDKNREEREAQKHKWDEIDRRQADLKYQMDRDRYYKIDIKDQIDALSKQLLDSDIKKANELAPSLMIVKYSELDTDGSIYDQKAFVTGVKSRLIAVDPGDIIERLVAKNKTRISFLNFIRATTGEISFIKDFLLCTKQAKIDAKNSVKKGPAAKMWKALEARSTKNAFNRMRKSGNDASSITTLVINSETAALMKKEFEFDIENPRNAKMIMQTYNLLAIIICDEALESVKSMYAGNDMFETQAYSFLEKESKDSSYKKVINLMGQINR